MMDTASCYQDQTLGFKHRPHVWTTFNGTKVYCPGRRSSSQAIASFCGRRTKHGPHYEEIWFDGARRKRRCPGYPNAGTRIRGVAAARVRADPYKGG